MHGWILALSLATLCCAKQPQNWCNQLSPAGCFAVWPTLRPIGHPMAHSWDWKSYILWGCRKGVQLHLSVNRDCCGAPFKVQKVAQPCLSPVYSYQALCTPTSYSCQCLGQVVLTLSWSLAIYKILEKYADDLIIWFAWLQIIYTKYHTWSHRKLGSCASSLTFSLQKVITGWHRVRSVALYHWFPEWGAPLIREVWGGAWGCAWSDVWAGHCRWCSLWSGEHSPAQTSPALPGQQPVALHSPSWLTREHGSMLLKAKPDIFVPVTLT